MTRVRRRTLSSHPTLNYFFITNGDNMATKIPALDTAGMLTELAKTTDRLMAYFFSSDGLQTSRYLGNVKSLSRILQEEGKDINGIEIRIREALEELYGNYDRSSVDVNIEEDEDNSSSLDIRVDITVGHNGKQYSVGRLIKSIDSKVENIFKINNG